MQLETQHRRFFMKVNLKVYDERLFDLIDPEAEFETVVDSIGASE